MPSYGTKKRRAEEALKHSHHEEFDTSKPARIFQRRAEDALKHSQHEEFDTSKPTRTFQRRAEDALKHSHHEELDTSKPTSIFQPDAGRSSTVTIAIPGSIVANAQTHESKTALVGQIARAAAVFCIDEIVIFEDGQDAQVRERHRSWVDDRRVSNNAAGEDSHTGWSDPSHFLFHLLSYLETPPHLRKSLFPLHPNLRTAGTLPSLDMPHHLRSNEWGQYREGMTVPSDDQNSGYQPKKKPKRNVATDATDGAGNDLKWTTVYTGLPSDASILLPKDLPPNSRLTLKFPTHDPPASLYDPGSAEAVDPAAPREEAGYYWGYQVRKAGTISQVLTECPWPGGYDVSVGTSERGRPVSEVLPRDPTGEGQETSPDCLPRTFEHLLVVFGGVAGLETAVEADPELAAKGLGKKNTEELFDFWINVCPGQGSRTIRSEEAVWVGMSGLWPWIRPGQ
ncbi:DUF171-domain-containing protein [Eremomyces bilateralis CBS 781.70]|uniref:DUF171-domain-containing protein n=1 Tax=Eremomyces bilateralis CBS 781.70 TaxID=1392243 RepID=A0A6G1G8T6_9PEZI|nr:DUF171-domain-containing protein [Eremomyces bilateralis CBS 781.70]KAF1814488.1 DUF171-domain-containing protein [Eremomyces bilateralis CBS 781.70]